MRHDKLFGAAAQEAQESTQPIKHGAVLVRSGKVIGRGHNSDRSRQTTVRRGNMHANAPALHSEVAALANAHRCIL